MAGTILLVTWDGAGNIPPEFTVCGALAGAGHQVHVLTHDTLKGRAEALGATFVPIRHAAQHDPQDPAGTLQDLIDDVILSDPLLSDIDEAVASVAPNLVIADSMMPLAVARLCHDPIPCVAFHHTIADFLFGGPLDQLSFSMKDAIDRILEARGLKPYARPVDSVRAADLLLTATYREFDPPSEHVPESLVHIGPLRGRPEPGGKPPERRYPERPYVLVSLSTSFMDQLALLQKIGDALAQVEVEGIITTGAAINPNDLSLPDCVAATRFVAHEELLPHTDLLISHAGHGTVMAGSTFGTPMLCFPMGRDQPLVAGRAKELGLAHIGDPDASTEDIARAVADALRDTKMAATARAFSVKAASHPGVELAVEQIESLMS